MKIAPKALLAGAVVVVGASARGFYMWQRSRAFAPAALLERLPRQEAVLAYLDFKALRSGGILQLIGGAPSAEDPDYRAFVAKTRFDYKNDLDAVIAAFTPYGRYLLVKGRFDWKSLEAYVREQGGECSGGLCRMQGSTPQRKISFLPLRSDVMALAVAADDHAALLLKTAREPLAVKPPDAPVWISLSPGALKSSENLPAQAGAFTQGIQDARAVTLAFAPEGKRLAARLEVLCRDARAATGAASQLTRATAMLAEGVAPQGAKPELTGLAGILSAGSFRAEGRRIFGYWPIERAFLEQALAAQ
jgi:hypothetical protein